MYLDYAIRLLARRFIVILLLALVGLALANVILATAQSYSTSSYVLLEPTAAQAAARGVQPDRLVKTTAQRIMSDAVLAPAASTVGETTSGLRSSVTVSGGAVDDVLELRVHGTTPERSQARAKAILDALAKSPAEAMSTAVLWTGSPTPTLGRLQLMGAGTLGGAMLGTLVVLGWGAVRRPILTTRGIIGRDIQVRAVRFAGRLGKRRGSEDMDRLIGEIMESGHERKMQVFVIDLAQTRATHELQEALLAEARDGFSVHRLVGSLRTHARRDPDTSAIVVMLGVMGKTSEDDVLERRKLIDGVGDDYLLVLVRDSNRGASDV